jgi:hypothetical protein
MSNDPVPTRTSFMAGLCFLGGVASTLCVTTSWFLTQLAGMGPTVELGPGESKGLITAAAILSKVTMAPAILSLVFWLAARASISESGGSMGGRGLYRTGLLISALSVVVALVGTGSIASRAGSLITDLEEAAADIKEQIERAQAERGFIGLEVKTIAKKDAERAGLEGGVRVKKVVDGTPAAAVFKVDDVIFQVQQESMEDQDDFTDAIGNRRPGERVTIHFVRDGKRQQAEVVLASRYPERLKPAPTAPPAPKPVENAPDVAPVPKEH